MSLNESTALSVSAAMQHAKDVLEGVTVRLVGEVSEVSDKPGYKAVYFTVKDESASLPCMMWKNRYNAADVRMRVGVMVELSGRFTLYAAKGRMNFDVFSLKLAGEGDLRLKVANLAKMLQAQGLMDPARKKPLPALPETIGLVTSPNGAAVHDVLRTLRRRYPLARVVFAGVLVEGATAPQQICDGLRCVYNAGAELILLVRGGGSFEDLMPFNDEALARCIAACPVPVVTGIGHEPDTSIADMVADVRASTPTAAAEAAAPSREDLCALLASRGTHMCNVASRKVEREQTRLMAKATAAVFRDPHTLFAHEMQALDIARMRLEHSVPRIVENARRDVGLRAARLHDLSPLATLARGYSITRDEQGHVVKSIAAVQPGERLCVAVGDGEIDCAVRDVREHAMQGLAVHERAARERAAHGHAVHECAAQG